MQVLGSALNSALRALQTDQTGLAIASNNISNAQTPGYTQQRAIIRPGEGGGSEVVGTEALRDRLIELRLREETSGKAEDELKHEGLSDIETQFNDSANTGMLPLISSFFNSFHALSTEPTSVSSRQEVINNASQLADLLNQRAGSLQDAQTKIDNSLKEDVASANSLIDQIADLTKNITQQETTEPAYALRDQRSQLVQQLSEIVSVHELETNGNYQLTVGGNRPVVYNNSKFDLTTSTDTNGHTTIGLGTDDITSELTGGKIGARLALRDQNIPQYLATLDQLAYGLVQNVNSIHSGGYDLDGNTGINFFTPLSSATDAAKNIAVNSTVANNVRRIAASDASSDSGNATALALGNLMNAPVFSGASIVEQYRSFVYTLGSDTANADLGTQQHDALLNQLQNRRQEVSGVSIDEETVKVLQFQRSFEASARVVKVVDDLLQLTLSIGQ